MAIQGKAGANLRALRASATSYWYFRYLMATELYMVERWEQRVTNVFFILLFLLLSYFNSAVLLNVTSSFSKYLTTLLISDAVDL